MPLKTKQSKSKAINRVKKVLPSAPKKTAEVIKEFFKSLPPKSQEQIKNPHMPVRMQYQIKIKSVKSFYEDHSNSRVMPSKKDVLIVKDENNQREKIRKRLLLDNISNIFNKFKEQYPEHKLGKSKFFELQPKWVITVQQHSKEVCKCQWEYVVVKRDNTSAKIISREF